MSEMHFSKNYTDLCRNGGTDAGFQFEFYCENCNDTWRSEFQPFRGGQVSGWLGRAAGIFGGVLGEASNAAEGLAEAGYGRARDKAFIEAVEAAKVHFHRCARCNQYVCDICWNKQKGLCLSCAPSVEAEVQAARVQGEIQGATEKALVEGQTRGAARDVATEKQLVCPECGARTEGAKFCPECGAKLAVASQCPGCNAQVSPEAKFCPECGEKLR